MKDESKEELTKPTIKIQLDSAWRSDMAGAEVVGGKILRREDDPEMNALEKKVVNEATAAASQREALRAMQIKATEGSVGPSSKDQVMHKPPPRRASRRGRSTSYSSSSGTSGTSKNSSRSACRRRRAPKQRRSVSPPPGIISEGYNQRASKAAPRMRLSTAQASKYDIFKVKFLQVVDDPKWDLEKVMQPFGENAKFYSPTILALRTQRSDEAIAKLTHSKIHLKFRVFIDRLTNTFNVRAPSAAAPPASSLPQAIRDSRRGQKQARVALQPSHAQIPLQS